MLELTCFTWTCYNFYGGIQGIFEFPKSVINSDTYVYVCVCVCVCVYIYIYQQDVETRQTIYVRWKVKPDLENSISNEEKNNR
jgi:hypothetical protein